MGLFAPLQIGPHRLQNRIIMAPLGRARADESRAPTSIVDIYYAQRAGAGLIVSEATHISPMSNGRPGAAAHHLDSQNDAWTRVVSTLHHAGGLIFQQLYQVGRKAHPSRLPGGAIPGAPSAVAAQGETPTALGPQPFPVPRALAPREISAVVDEFRVAARNAKRAGFDGVELHGANGFLIDQFLRDGSNRRADIYGGAIYNRARFLLDVVDAVSSVFGADRVGVRLSPHFRSDGIADSNPAATFSYAAAALNERRIAYLHIVEGPPEASEFFPESPAKPLAPLLREAFHGPLILAGGYDQASAETTIGSGLADAIAFGRLFIANPDLPERFRKGAPLNVPDPSTFYTGGARGYIDYPSLPAVEAAE
ncbi:MAG TPA: alkene reductase [Xanthobacteraceae bacterium]|nr:alkene reductase [Xanthobacteraceae bacterium]